jgi:hypothetical protein
MSLAKIVASGLVTLTRRFRPLARDEEEPSWNT